MDPVMREMGTAPEWAYPELQSDLNRLDELFDWHDALLQEGVSRKDVPALESLNVELDTVRFPAALYTERRSHVNKTYALEGVVKAVRNTIKMILQKIMDIIVDVSKWVLNAMGMGKVEKAVKVSKETQEKVESLKKNKGSLDVGAYNKVNKNPIFRYLEESGTKVYSTDKNYLTYLSQFAEELKDYLTNFKETIATFGDDPEKADEDLFLKGKAMKALDVVWASNNAERILNFLSGPKLTELIGKDQQNLVQLSEESKRFNPDNDPYVLLQSKQRKAVIEGSKDKKHQAPSTLKREELLKFVSEKWMVFDEADLRKSMTALEKDFRDIEREAKAIKKETSDLPDTDVDEYRKTRNRIVKFGKAARSLSLAPANYVYCWSAVLDMRVAGLKTFNAAVKGT